MVSDGPLVSDGPFVSDGPLVSGGPFVSDGPFASDGPLVSDGPLISGGPFASDDPLVPDGPFASDAPLVSDGPFVSDGSLGTSGPFGRVWYRGDCHVHSTLSVGGELTPERLAADAVAAGLDFIATTEHNTAEGHGAWGSVAGDLLVILGQEVTTRTGHWLALGVEPGQVLDWQYGLRDDAIAEQLERVHRVGGLCVAAHPFAPYPSGSFMYPYQGFDMVEVWNGRWRSDLPWNADNEAALAEWGRSLAADIHRGRWRPAIGNSDAHLAGQIAAPHTVVWAEQPNTSGILAGLRAGRSWIAESATVDLSFDVRAGGVRAGGVRASDVRGGGVRGGGVRAGDVRASDVRASDVRGGDVRGGDRLAGIGESLTTGDEPAVARVAVRGVPSGVVSLHTDRGLAHRRDLPGDGTAVVEWQTTAAESAFVRVEVRHPDHQMAALTNPILLT